MFDNLRFLTEQFGNADAVIGLANHFNVDVPAKDTLRKWFERGSIPSDWWPVVLALLEMDRGAPVSVLDYMGRESENDNGIFG